MKLLKKLINWFKYYLGVEDTDGADDSSLCCYSGVKCYADDCGTCKERTDYFKEV